MAKKYLLYIHDVLFENEPNKSKLINNLLERHYHDTVDGGKTQEDAIKGIRKAQKALREAPVPTQDRYIRTPEGVVGPVSLPVQPDRFTQGVCKVHGLPLDTRGRCLQKGCKYSK